MPSLLDRQRTHTANDLTKADIGIDAPFGSAQALITLAEMTAKGEGFGKIIGLGSARMCEKYGRPELSMGVKKQKFPAYDSRGIQGMGLGYATSNRGACHLHEHSERRGQRFISENCAAIPDTLLESALFGHERGAFTGADRARQDLFHAADGGTLFLDEIGEMSAAMQSKLLRVLQNGEVRAVGGSRVSHVNVRLVTATHRDLRAMVAAGTFREDLYYRVTVVTLELPPLRERRSDIPLLVRHFVSKHQPGQARRITPEAMQRLVTAPWPGNVRQLENEVQRLLVMAGDPVDVRDVAAMVAVTAAPGADADAPLAGSLALRDHVDALERRLITEAMARTDSNQTRAALTLGISRYGLQKMMKRLGLRS